MVLYILQAVEEVNRGQIKTDDKMYELKSLQEQNKKIEVCKLMTKCMNFITRTK